MTIQVDNKTVDTGMFIIANLVNLIMVGIFLSRPAHLDKLERTLGLIQIALTIPVTGIIIFNVMKDREWWSIVLPGLLVVFLLLELLLDYILKIEFRQTALLGPYLLLYYLSLMGMIGYTFLIDKPYGFITLVTYFIQLGATWYSYTKVGHGGG